MEPVTMFLLLGGAAAAFLLPQVIKNTTASAAASAAYPYLVTGAPALPSSYSQAYYLSYIYPAMVKANPNVTNPSYTLTSGDAAQYMANYQDVSTWANLSSTINSKQAGGTVLGALQYHWHTYGVPQQRTFLWLNPPDTAAYVPAQSNPNSSGSSSTFSDILSTAGTVASYAIALAGPQNQGSLNDLDIETIVTASAVIKNILPFYKNSNNSFVVSFDNELDQILTRYI